MKNKEMKMTADMEATTKSSDAIGNVSDQQEKQPKCNGDDNNNGLHHVEQQEQIEVEEDDDDAANYEEREEGEIVDEFEDIISSDEELSMRKRIEELEARNAELEKIANISGIYDYDLDYVNDRYQKSETIAYNHNDTADDYHQSSLYTPSTTKRLLKKPSILSKSFPPIGQGGGGGGGGVSTTKSTPAPPPSITVTVDRDLKHRHHHHHHHHHSSYNKNYEIYYYTDERDYISPSPESLLIRHRKRKRKYQKESRSRNRKSTKSDKRKKKARFSSPSPSPLLSSSGDENEGYTLNRDELRIALKRDIKTTTTAQNTLQKNLKIKVEKINNSKNDNDQVIRTIDLVTEEADADEVDGVDQKNERIVVGNSDEDDDDDSASLEEQELRLIALKSAVVKKHLARKKRRESDDKRPYSPSDNFIEMYDLCNNGSSKDLYSLSSPFGCAMDTPPPQLGLEQRSYNDNSMDISPITSPDLSINNDDVSADCVLKPIDMEIVNSDSSNPSPIFEQQQRNYNNWIPIDQIPLPSNEFRLQDQQQQQQYLICSPKAIKPVPLNESYVPLIMPPALTQQIPSLLLTFQEQGLQRRIEVDDNEKLVIRSSSLDDEIDGGDRIKGEEDDDESTDEEESALRALLLATMNSAQKQKLGQQQIIVNDEKRSDQEKEISDERGVEEEDESSQLEIGNHKPPTIISCDENNVPENKDEESSIDIEALKDLLLITMNDNKKRQQHNKKPINKTEIVLKEAVKRLKNKEAAATPPPTITTVADQNESIRPLSHGSAGYDDDRQIEKDFSLRIIENCNSFSPTIMQQHQQHLMKTNEKIINESTNKLLPDNLNNIKTEKNENYYEFNDDDIENMINIFEKVQFDNIKLLHENITKQHQEHKEEELVELLEKNDLEKSSTEKQLIPVEQNSLIDVVEDGNIKLNDETSKEGILEVDLQKPSPSPLPLSTSADNFDEILEEKTEEIHKNRNLISVPSNSSSVEVNAEVEQMKAPDSSASKIQNTTAKQQQSEEISLKKLATAVANAAATVKAKKKSSSSSLPTSSQPSSSNIKIVKNVNSSGKITKTRTKIVNNKSNATQNTQLLRNRKIIKTIINSKDDISSLTNPVNVNTLSSAALTAFKIAQKSSSSSSSSNQQTTTRFITKPEIPKIGKIIIRLGESSSDEDDGDEINNENDNIVENSNSYNLYCGDNDDNASPMSLQMDDSPIYSPIPSSTNQILDNELVEKTVVNEVFQAKLDEFLKSARTKIDNIKKENEKITTTVPATLKTVKTIKELPSKAIATKTPTALKHLPPSSQLEYRRLVNRMKTLEKQKQSRHTKTNSIRDNLKIIIKNDQTVVNGKLDEIPSKSIVPSANQRIIVTDATTNSSLGNLNEINQKEKLIKKVLIKNASNLPHSEKKNLSMDDEIKKETNVEKEDAGINEENTPIETGNENEVKKEEETPMESGDKHNVEKSSTEVQSSGKDEDSKTEDGTNDGDGNETTSNKLESLEKIELLNKYENHLRDESCNLLEHITNTIDLVLQARKEKLHKLQLQQKHEQLQNQLKIIENDLDQQNKKLSRKIYPEISKSHKIIVDLKSKCNNLGKITTNLGKSLNGNDYGLILKEKSLILEKSKELSNEIKNLKSLNQTDLKQIMTFQWKTIEKLNNQGKEKQKENLTDKILPENDCVNQIKVAEKLNLRNEVIDPNENAENKEVSTTSDQEIMEIINNKMNQTNESEKIVEDDAPVIPEGSQEISKNPSNVKVADKTLFKADDEMKEVNMENEEIKEMESNVENIVETSSKVCENIEESTADSKSSKEKDTVLKEIIKQKKQVTENNITTIVETVEKEKEENEENTSEAMKTYVSPLEHIQQDRTINDPNGIICPYQLMGQCGDKECKFVHLPIH